MTEVGTQAGWQRRQAAYAFDVRPYVDGRLIDARSDDRVGKIAPADGQPLFDFAAGSAADVDAAVAGARRAFDSGLWAHQSLLHRKTVMMRFAALIERDAETLALLDAIEVGKPIRDALTIDVPMALLVLRGAIEAAESLTGSTFPSDGRSLALSLRVPHGVVAGIVGWNFPLVLAAQKIGPALITGNSLVLKPSELTSLSTLHLAKLATEAGVPDGVFNVVPGLGATVGDAIAHHNDIGMLSFTGSTATGKRLLQASGASNMKRLVLECGGKSANIVFADAPELDQVAAQVFQRMFWNSGQVCTAGTRLLVHNHVRDQLLDLVERQLGTLKAGHPLAPDTSFGPLISGAQHRKVLDYIASGRAEGATLYRGGSAMLADSGGFFVEPTIFTDVAPDQRIAQEEIFGPVLSVIGFDDEDEAVAIANRTTYGLAAYAWTRNLATAQRLLRDVKAGAMAINATGTPTMGAAFGSMPLEPHGQSGLGSEFGIEGLAAYTLAKAAQIHV